MGNHEASPFLFCFGLGYSAKMLARRLAAKGWRIAGTSRSGAADGIWPIHGFERGHKLDPALFADATHILVSVPPDEDGDPVVAEHGEDIAGIDPSWLGYLSTTGVYGDRGGGWVDEQSDLTPSGERGRRRLVAEQQWLGLHQKNGLATHLFRLAGIYGPGRSALDTVRSGAARRIDKPGQVFSRIHVEDIATILEASIARPHPGAAYNVADDEPTPPRIVIEHACDLLGVAQPPLEPFDPARLSPMAASFYAENKRVHNDRIKRELGVHLAYPNYRDGLASLLAAGS